MTQRSLFDDFSILSEPLLASPKDPETSHEAARELEASGALGRQRQEVIDALRRFPDSTSAELAKRSGLDRHLCGRRLPELEYLERVTRGEARTCTVSGRKAQPWRAV